MSAHAVKQVLADLGGVDIAGIEEVWHALAPPYTALFDWLEARADKPACEDAVAFRPVMLARTIEEPELAAIAPDEFLAEWKYDGLRVQLVSAPAGKALFSRAGDDMAAAFPEVMERVDFEAVLDGELIVKGGGFSHLQQRLNRKAPDAKLAAKYPGHLILYDALSLGGRDLRALPLVERKAEMARWFEGARPAGMELAEALAFGCTADLHALRAEAAAQRAPHAGLMLKRLDSAYVAGRPTGLWYKWKCEPKLVDAVLMYAQRGAGERFADYTFGLWREGALLPIGKAGFGGADGEAAQLAAWVHKHALQRFGPVVEVEKELVFEVAFDAVRRAARHKAGVALKGARIERIRWDKPASEADMLECLAKWVD
jgi:DNA ligase-1